VLSRAALQSSSLRAAVSLSGFGSWSPNRFGLLRGEVLRVCMYASNTHARVLKSWMLRSCVVLHMDGISHVTGSACPLGKAEGVVTDLKEERSK
jgi:hypothetical protein